MSDYANGDRDAFADGVLRGTVEFSDGVVMPLSYSAYGGRTIERFTMNGVAFEPVKERDSVSRVDNRPEERGMTKCQELMFRLLAVAAGAAVTTLNLVACATLTGERRREIRGYAKDLRDEYSEVAREISQVQ